MDVRVDRLSSLSDDLIHRIFSFIDFKDVIKTIALSSRYRFIWTSLPYLNFSTRDFMLPNFSEFLTHVLSRRDTQIEVYSVNLSFWGKVSLVFVERIMNYAFSHNVQEMTVSIRLDDYDHRDDKTDFPSLFSSQSLKHLTLSGQYDFNQYINPTPTLELPALTTLHLEFISFNAELTDLFSKCSNLKTLSLKNCSTNYCDERGWIGIDICHPGLSNLTLENGCYYLNVLNVDAPQLKNLTIKDWSNVHLLSAPKLDSLVFKGYPILQHSPNSLCSLEKADLCFYGNDDRQLNETYAHKVVDLLQQIRCVKYLTLNTESIQLLSSFKELISHRTSPFSNLRSLKFYPHDPWSEMEETMPIEVKNYLLESSSGATLTMVSCKEITGLRYAVYMQKLMAELRVMLEDGKAYSETTSLSQVESHDTKMHGKREAQVENEKKQPVEKMQMRIEGGMAKIKICWEDLDMHIQRGRRMIHEIVSRLREIEEYFNEDLPTSKRDKLQARFSSLHAEVAIVVKNIIDGTKIQCDWIHELATTSQAVFIANREFLIS